MIEREPAESSVRVTFTLPTSEGEVSVVGSFNDWDPDAGRLQVEGAAQSVTVELAPGSRHEFRYLGTDGRWFDDPDADEHPDGNGVIVLEPDAPWASDETGVEESSAQEPHESPMPE